MSPRMMARVLLLAVWGAAGAAAQELALVDRFGPDGLPFSHDDPLAVGAYAAEHRFMAMAQDACSEEPGLVSKSAHGHPSAHPTGTFTQGLETSRGHESVYDPNRFLDTQTLREPFDFTAWLSSLNLADGSQRNWRLYPEPQGPAGMQWMDVEDTATRGWGATAWKPKEVQDQINDLWQAGSPARNLHVEALGLGHRDVKPRTEIPIGIKHETLQYFPQFPAALAGGRIDMWGQQDYLEAWVVEMMNMDNGEAAISGNFVADVAGLQISTTLSNYTTQETMEIEILGITVRKTCEAHFDYLYIEVGGPAGDKPPSENQKKPSEYVRDNYLEEIVDAIFNEVEIGGDALCSIGGALKSLFEGKIKAKLREKIMEATRRLDPVAELVILDGEDLMDQVRIYSGLAEKTQKNPFDRVALGSLVKLGNFKPDRWMPWKMVGDVPSAMSFNLERAGIDPQTVREVLENEAGLQWRYNFGSTFLAKSGRLFGNSAGKDTTPGRTRIPDNDRDKIPDIMESFAKRWVYLEMDTVDPYGPAENSGTAWWQGVDILFVHDRRSRLTLDWPPPNFGFGRGQVLAFRTGSGGEYVSPADVDPLKSLQSAFLICIDPVSSTYSVAGSVFRAGDGSNSAGAMATPSARGNLFGWTPPVPMPTGLDPAANTSGLRWVSAAANHHREEMTQLRWMWDFENDGTIDTEHAQAMNDVGDPAFPSGRFGAVFAYQPSAGGSQPGRTGFALVPMDAAARTALQ